MNDTDYDKLLGQRLKTLREKHRMRQADVGEKVGLSHQQIQKYETGQSQVRASLAHRFAELFNIPVGSLLDRSAIIAQAEMDYPASTSRKLQVAEAPPETLTGAPAMSDDIVKLVNHFSQIDSPKKRTILLDLAASMASE